ncbi:MAG: PcfJ domain-containing protein [Verrucomicrobiota bacterium]
MSAPISDDISTRKALFPWKLLKHVCAVNFDGARTLCRALEQSEEAADLDRSSRKQLLSLLIALERHTTLLGRVNHNSKRRDAIHPDHLIKLFRYRRHWVRDPRDFPQSHHQPKAQLEALVQHLFVRYPLPPYLLRAYEGTEQDRRVFFHVAKGDNIRTLNHFQPLLTKAQAHLFHRHSNPDLTLLEGALLAMALSHGVPMAHAQWMMRHPLIQRGPFPFWSAFMAFLGRQEASERRLPNYLLEYLHAHRTLPPERADGPPRTFRFRHRTLANLLEQALRWQERSRGSETTVNRTWEPTSWMSQLPLDKLRYGWQIFEILSQKDLSKEGYRMKHCVFTYLNRCLEHKSRIFTLVYLSPEHPTGWHRVTIELVPRRSGAFRYELCQAKGKKNRSPSTEEWQVLLGWTKQNQILVREDVK